MKDMTEDKPKCLVKLHGKTLLQRQLQAIRAAGIADIAIVTGYKRELLQEYELTEFFNPRWAETNMVSSLTYASSWLEKWPCIVSYSDIFYETSAITSLMDSSASLAITYDPNWKKLWAERFSNPLLDAETFRLDNSGSVIEIGNKPESLDDVQGQYMGLLRFTPQSWQEMIKIRSEMKQHERDKMHMTGTLQRIISANRMPIIAISYEYAWGEVDSEADLAVYK